MRTRLQVNADRAAEASLRSIGAQFLQLREDAGLPKSVVARAAGIDPTYLGYVEGGERAASLAVLTRIAAALGADFSARVYPTSGPPIRDRIQARMVDAFLTSLPADWDRHVEVPVYRPVRGIVDVVIVRRATGRIVSIEAHSELRRLEQQLGWAATKADALAVVRPVARDRRRRSAPGDLTKSCSCGRRRTRGRSPAHSPRRSPPPIRPTPATSLKLSGIRPDPGPATASSGSGSRAARCRSSRESRAGLGREANLTTSQLFLGQGLGSPPHGADP